MTREKPLLKLQEPILNWYLEPAAGGFFIYVIETLSEPILTFPESYTDFSKPIPTFLKPILKSY